MSLASLAVMTSVYTPQLLHYCIHNILVQCHQVSNKEELVIYQYRGYTQNNTLHTQNNTLQNNNTAYTKQYTSY